MSELKLTFEPGPTISTETLHINQKKKVINMALKQFQFKDGATHILYAPALNFSAYGETQEKAMEMMKDIIHDYFDSLISLKPEELEIELSKYGWHRSIFRKKFENKVHVDIQGILRNFELPSDTPVTSLAVSA